MTQLRVIDLLVFDLPANWKGVQLVLESIVRALYVNLVFYFMYAGTRVIVIAASDNLRVWNSTNL